jgi:membrane associated rhomboid family serine protease
MPPFPPTNKALLIACVAIFLVGSFVPLLGPGGWFALWPVASGNFMPWQVITYALLHGGTAHLIFNMLGLWLFGSELELLWGRRRYLQFIVACVLAAAGAQLVVTWLMGQIGPTVGASGAIYGLLLAYALSFPRRQFDLVGLLPMALLAVPSPAFSILGMLLYFMLLTNRQAVPIPPVYVRALTMVACFGGIELLLGLFGHSGIAHFAHLGGMVGGWLMIRYWRGLPPFGGQRRRR